MRPITLTLALVASIVAIAVVPLGATASATNPAGYRMCTGSNGDSFPCHVGNLYVECIYGRGCETAKYVPTSGYVAANISRYIKCRMSKELGSASGATGSTGSTGQSGSTGATGTTSTPYHRIVTCRGSAVIVQAYVVIGHNASGLAGPFTYRAVKHSPHRLRVSLPGHPEASGPNVIRSPIFGPGLDISAQS
ncbi:MAG: hypothetical protein ABSG64_14320 [Solirubrobacteraceae bacterium]|jgi:hypothetical protein